MFVKKTQIGLYYNNEGILPEGVPDCEELVGGGVLTGDDGVGIMKIIYKG